MASDEVHCGGCGLGPHRYSTHDPYHDYDSMACVNALRVEVERLRDALGIIAEGLIGDVTPAVALSLRSIALSAGG